MNIMSTMDDKDYKILNECLCCGENNLTQILDLTDQPLANSYKTNRKDSEKKYPLQLNLCLSCYHNQLSIAVNPDIMYKNYLYVSGTSKTLAKYSEKFARIVYDYYIRQNNKYPESCLDIACNDGSQLDHFKTLDVETFGIDPAENLYPISSKNHSVICDYYTKGIFNKKFDLMLAQNVFAHNSNPHKFLSDCAEDLEDGGLLFIQTSQANMIVNGEFDTIYHEHISFFNTNSILSLSRRSGLYLNDVFKTDIHGTSYVFVFSKDFEMKESVSKFLEDEASLRNVSTYEKYATGAKEIISELKSVIEEYRIKNYRLVGYGAAAKGNTLLNFGNIELDFIIDDNELKQNLYTPGTNIPIKSIDELDTISESENILFVPLAWNFYDEIVERIKDKRNIAGDHFVRYFPQVKLD